MLELERPEFVEEIEKATLVQEVKDETGEYWIYKGYRVPKHFGWWIVLMELSRMKNVELEVIYSRNLVRNKPDQFTIDRENCIAPEMPLIVHVYKVKRERVNYGLEKLFGRRYKKVRERVATLKDLNGLDPHPAESLNMIKMLL